MLSVTIFHVHVGVTWGLSYGSSLHRKQNIQSGRGGKNKYMRIWGKEGVCPSEAAAPMISDVLNTAVRPAVNLRGSDEKEVVNV